MPIVSFATRFSVAAEDPSRDPLPLRLDVSFEGEVHNGLATNTFVSRTLAERPEVRRGPLAPLGLLVASERATMLARLG